MLKTTRARLCILWLLIIPPVMIYLAMNHAPQEINWFYIGTITLFAFLTVLFPVKQQGRPILLLMWITVPAFLKYGLFVEIIVTQIALLAKGIYYRKDQDNIEQMLFSSILLFVLSFMAAGSFYMVGGEQGLMNFWQLIFSIAVYQITHKVLYETAKRLFNNNSKDTRSSIGESLMIMLTIPFTLTFYYLVEFVGLGAFFLLGIPYFFIVIILRLYNNTEKVNQDLQLVGVIGHQLSYNLTEEKIVDQFVEHLTDILHTDYVYLFDHHNGWLELIRAYEKDSFKKPEMSYLHLKHGIGNSVLANNKPVIYGEKKEWQHLADGYDYGDMQSVLAIPYIRNQVVEGVLLTFSTKKKAFEEYQLQIADIFCSYFTVSVERARNLESTVKESQRCGLTELFNYQYLEERLEFEFKRLQDKNIQSLTVLMLDIDYFKKVNDTYGHESGNDVLIELARILESQTPKNSIVGRYGGEEFIYILPDITKNSAVDIAEEIRQIIETHKFTITPDLGNSKEKIDISITASIGLSSIPEDTDDVKTLIRNADRALYLGAKRAGRNRVASYIK